MAKAKNENKEVENTEVINEVIKNEPSDREKELQNQVDSLQADMKAMMEQMKAMMSMNAKVNEPQATKTSPIKKTIHQFDKYELLTIVNMYDGGATLEGDFPSLRFNQFGDTANVTYDELNKIVAKYKSHFEDLVFRILDDRAVDNLRLRKNYDKVAIDELEFEELFLNNDANAFVNKVKTLPKNLQESAISLVIQRCVDGDRRYWDLNKFAVINSAYGIDLNKCISMRTVIEEQ